MSSYEYNQLLKFLYFEGYADSYEEAENLLEEMSDEEFEELYERKRAHSFPLKPSERRSVENIRRMLGGDYSVSPGSGVSTPTRSERKPDSTSTQNPKRKVRKLEFEVRENFESIVEYLFVEGYADTIENAELMAENISEEWVNEILEVSEAKYWYQDKSPEAQEKFRKMDQEFHAGQRNKRPSNRPAERHGRYTSNSDISLTQQNARDRFNRQKEIEAKWAEKDRKENKK